MYDEMFKKNATIFMGSFNPINSPFVMVRMNEYGLISGSDNNNNTLMSNGAADCIIFVCHNPVTKRAILCHVTRLTKIDQLIDDTHKFVTGGNFAGCNLYLISGLFSNQNAQASGIYQTLRGALTGHPVETIATTAFSINVASGRICAGAQVVAMCGDLFPTAAQGSGSSMFGMGLEAPTCAYKSPGMQSLLSGFNSGGGKKAKRLSWS